MPPPRTTTTARPPAGGAVDHASLLSPLAYDDDAASLNSRSDQDTDSEDDELQLRARNSRELRAHDRIVLMEEEELDRLVTDQRREQERRRAAANLALPNPFEKIEQLVLGRRNSSSSSMTAHEEDAPERREKKKKKNNNNNNNTDASADRRSGRRARRDERKRRLLEDAQHGEDGALMHEMERGHMKEGSSTGDSSDLDGLSGLDDDDDYEDDDDDDHGRRFPGHKGRAMAQARGRGGWKRWAFVWALTTLGFAILVLAAWKATNAQRAAAAAAAASGAGGGAGASARLRLVSNGTALFAPTTIIISLDGFRADFLGRGLTPSLNALAREGVSPRHMLPSFPSVTFPNHHTLATGLYPEAHGVVGNTFWDPALGAQFYYTDKARSQDPRWWGGEPFWVTAERQGARAAVHMWPGSEAHIRHTEASIVDKYNGKEALEAKKKEEKEEKEMEEGKEDYPAARGQQQLRRPQLIAAYVPNVDADGHRYGPNSTEIRATIQAVDGMVGSLLAGLAARNLTRIVNVVVVSDHGMATTDVSRLLQLEDLVDVSKVEHVDGWPLYGLRPRDPRDLAGLHGALRDKRAALAAAAGGGAGAGAGFDVYLRDVDMPPRWHFSRNERIAPLWIVPWAGWAIVRRDEFVVEGAREKGLVYHPRGLHGYDHEHPLMRAIFIARGPAFAHPANSEIEVFQNIEVYNLVCDSIGIVPSPNNGTLRLPLKTIGTHKDQDRPEAPADPETAPAAASTRVSTVVSSSAPAKPLTASASSSTEAVLTNTSSGVSVSVSVSASTTIEAASATVSQASQTSSPTTTTATPGNGQPGPRPDDSLTDKLKGVWEWVKDEFGKAWGKAQGHGESEKQSS
ncbi:putative pyrophosphatase/phosphodiesterase [Escovopsis weberi]|uniref:Putative pyrophosphatase/phosphodiesterase n=1 Tax=Escovopsis weberi TaxID=150374 RepID=A0A0M8MY16_ESCWE|nr:putative pyrophosphatase/phosphodiesterase [Escovopsis weberi]